MERLTPLGATRVFLVEDHPLMRAGVRNALRKASDIEIVGEADSGERALEALRRLNPNVVMLDIGLPDVDGITLLHTIRTICPDARVIMLSCQSNERAVRTAMEAGASGYLTKSADPEQIVEAIRRAMAGQISLSPEAATRLVSALRGGQSPREAALTPRELEVWRAMADGLNNAEIARDLFITERTVKFHIHNLLRKLGFRDRAEAICAAHRRGLLT